MPELHEQSPTTRFSDRAGDYVRFRPTYPPAAIDAALHGLGEPRSVTAADVGAGTGISARLLAGRGVRVIAVEPNREMREQGMRDAAGVAWRDGRAEATGLADAAVDLVLCAQSFHWFEPDAALAEFRRILRPGGRVALVWNERDDADPATAEYGRLIREASGDHAATSHAGHHRPLESSPLFAGFRVQEFRNTQTLDLAGLLGRARSASYVPKGGPAWDRLQRGLASLHARFARGDAVHLDYIVRLYLAHTR